MCPPDLPTVVTPRANVSWDYYLLRVCPTVGTKTVDHSAPELYTTLQLSDYVEVTEKGGQIQETV